jgi:translation initiation factor IF-2
MNVTELARKIKIPTSELKDLLPRLGFDIGRKAIKVDDKVAKKIIEKFKTSPQIITQMRQKETIEEEETEKTSEKQKEIVIPSIITVRDFAALLNKPVATIIQELMKNGILANLNEQIDYETANIIAEDFGFQTTTQAEQKETITQEDTLEILLKDKANKLQSRPPVVVVIGHVDHGKTQLLDTIRKTNVIVKESGGITQHIGAYQITKNNKAITLIDTPGHKAFTAMRSRGARIADMAILVIAADDGIKPQTEEAIKIIQSAKIPFIVALNKIDKPEADIEKVKQQLAQKNILPEDWGGKITCVPISAKTGQGIDELLEHLLLLADVEKKHIQANPDRTAVGTIVESHIDKGEGPVSTVIVQTGTLKQGDAVQVGHVVGKIKAMKSHTGETIKQADPSTPVKILGLKQVPEVGDILQIIENRQSLKKMEKEIQHQRKQYRDKQKWQAVQTKKGDKKDKKKFLNIIIKADMLGSQEAIIQSLEMLQLEDVKIKIVKTGLGNINDKDILQAESTDAYIYGFNIKADARAQEIAKEKDIPIHLYNVIYDLIDHVKKEVEKSIEYKTEIIELGRIKVLAIFRTEKKNMIIGGLVTKGKIEAQAKVRIINNDKIIGEGIITQLQQAKQEVTSVPAGSECGIQIKGASTIQVGDFLEAYKEEIKTPKKPTT